ncbi:MAG: hypothetical protein HKN85_09230 [Gammaproteobacteria bacterium]|nr:hypothetical protein [Gammaproteobacteria bacterium]
MPGSSNPNDINAVGEPGTGRSEKPSDAGQSTASGANNGADNTAEPGHVAAKACPKCGCIKIAKSRAVGSDRLWMRFLPWRPYRCQQCYQRFWHREAFLDDERRLVSWAYLLGGLLVLIALRALWVAPTDTDSNPMQVKTNQRDASSGVVAKPMESKQPALKDAEKPTGQAIIPTNSEIQKLSSPGAAAPGASAPGASKRKPAVPSKSRLSAGARRDIIEKQGFNKPPAVDPRFPAISSDELKRRLAQAKKKAEAAELINRQKLANLENTVNADPAEAQSILKVEINYRIEQWQRAWEAGNLEAYLDNYSEDFIPPSSMTRHDWLVQRAKRVRPEKNIGLSLSAFEVEFNNDNSRSTVRFNQRYQSNAFIEKSLKELVLSRHGGQWYILSERELGKQ